MFMSGVRGLEMCNIRVQVSDKRLVKASLRPQKATWYKVKKLRKWAGVAPHRAFWWSRSAPLGAPAIGKQR